MRDWVAALQLTSMVRTKGIMYGQNERAKVPKAHKKITVTMRKGTSSQRYCTLNASKTVAIAPIMGNTNKYGRCRAQAPESAQSYTLASAH